MTGLSPVFLGIAGGTGSGKTTVANSIYQKIGSARIAWISHDSYYRDFGSLVRGLDPPPINYDHPDSLESELLALHLDMLRRGESIEVPLYDFQSHARSVETRRVDPRRVVIVEGILVLAEPEIRKRIDIKLFVDTPPDIRLLRRLLRDTRERGRGLESVVEQYLSTVRPMHEEFVEPSKRYADLIIPEGGENRVALDAIISRIEHLVGSN